MLSIRSYAIAPLVAVGLVLALATSALAGPVGKPSGPVVLTVGGNVADSNRGPTHEFEDAFLNFHGQKFEKAVEFDLAMLESLGLHEVKGRYGGWPKEYTFAGPRLKDVLAAAGAADRTVKVVALDGYAVELTPEELDAQDWILAIKRDGAFLKIGEFGPAWIAYERPDGQPITDDEVAKFVWTVFYIEAL